MRKPIIAGNWKMNMNPTQTTEFVNAIKANLPKFDQTESVIGAPAVDLPALLEAAKGTDLKVAAENCYFEDAGAFTGETSPKTLNEMGVDMSSSVIQNVVITSTKLMKISIKKHTQSSKTT